MDGASHFTYRRTHNEDRSGRADNTTAASAEAITQISGDPRSLVRATVRTHRLIPGRRIWREKVRVRDAREL